MASAQFSVNVYQFNSQDPVPASNVSKLGFPFAAVLIRAANLTGTTGQPLSNGVIVYSQIQVIATGASYYVLETPASLQALS